MRKDPLLIVPGLLCDARVFIPQITSVSGRRSVQIATPGTRDSLADMAEAILETAPERFALAGHSMGGMIALEMLARAPDRVSRLALMDTNFLPDSPATAADRDVQIASARAGQLKRILSDDLGPRYAGNGPHRAAVIRTVIDMGISLGQAMYVAQSQALRTRRDLGFLLEQICVPTLVLCGRDDVLCPVSRHELMAARISGAVLEIIDGAGHFPMLEQADATTAAMQRWLTDALVLN